MRESNFLLRKKVPFFASRSFAIAERMRLPETHQQGKEEEEEEMHSQENPTGHMFSPIPNAQKREVTFIPLFRIS